MKGTDLSDLVLSDCISGSGLPRYEPHFLQYNGCSPALKKPHPAHDFPDVDDTGGTGAEASTREEPHRLQKCEFRSLNIFPHFLQVSSAGMGNLFPHLLQKTDMSSMAGVPQVLHFLVVIRVTSETLFSSAGLLSVGSIHIRNNPLTLF